MCRLIAIKKIQTKNFIHFYAVYEEDSLTDISYYMGLNSHEKKIYFYFTSDFENPFCIYDVHTSMFEKKPEETPILKSISVVKGIQAIKNNDLPDDISYIA